MAYFSKELALILIKFGCGEYLRKSTKIAEDKQIRSIPEQRIEIDEQILSKYKFKSVKEFPEQASAFEVGREKFRLLLDEIKSGKIQVILCWHPNRLARNYREGGELVQLMSDGLLKYVITPHAVFENTGRDKEYLMQEFTRATRDSDDKSDAVKRGNKDKFFEQKEWAGLAKPGYINAENPITKEKFIDTDGNRWNLIRKALELLLTGSYTRMQALYTLNNVWGYRTRKTTRQGGKPLSISAFYRIVSDPFYYGLMIRNLEGVQQEIMGNHKPMITKEQFDKLQIILGINKNTPNSKSGDILHRFLTCDECGAKASFEEKWQIICDNCSNKFAVTKDRKACPACGALIEEMKNKKLLHYAYYAFHSPGCTQGSLPLSALEKTVNSAIDKLTISPRLKDWAVKYLNEMTDIEVNDRQIINENIDEAIKDVDKRIDNLMKLYISTQNTNHEVLSSEELMGQKKPLVEEKELLLAEKNKLGARQLNWFDNVTRAFDFACYAKHWFEYGDTKTRAAIIKALGSNLTIKDRKLYIGGEKPWYILASGKNKLQSVIDNFEPGKNVDTITNNKVLELVNTSWLGDRDSNPNMRDQNPQSYH